MSSTTIGFIVTCSYETHPNAYVFLLYHTYKETKNVNTLSNVTLIQKLTPHCFLQLLKLRSPCFLQHLNWSTIGHAISVSINKFLSLGLNFPSFTTRQRWQNGKRGQLRDNFEEPLLHEGTTQQRKSTSLASAPGWPIILRRKIENIFFFFKHSLVSFLDLLQIKPFREGMRSWFSILS